MLTTTSKAALAANTKRGFGLIDVSLGIIAGIGLLVGAVILFQQVTTNNAVSEITRNSVSISSEIRSAARNMESFDDLAGADDVIDLVAFGLEPAMTQNVTAAADGDEFSLAFGDLSQRACDRAAIAEGNLGANVTGATCATPVDGTPTLTVTFRR